MRLTYILPGIFIITALFALTISRLQSPIDSYMFAIIATSIIVPLLIPIFLLRIPVSTPTWVKATSWICFTLIVVGFYSFVYIKAVGTLNECDSQNGTLVHDRTRQNSPGSLKCLTQDSI